MINARRLYGHPFDFKPAFKLWLAGNYRPVIRGQDDGIWRRARLIHCRVNLPAEDVDKRLAAKLWSEASGILNWGLKGCLAWQCEGLGEARSVEIATAEYRSAMDHVRAFVEHRTRPCENGGTKPSVLHGAYLRWAADENAPRLSTNFFGQRLSDINVPSAKIRGDKVYRVVLRQDEVGGEQT